MIAWRLHEYEERRGDPVDEGTSRPLMGEGEMQKLQDLEEGSETVHEPVLILFSDTSL